MTITRDEYEILLSYRELTPKMQETMAELQTRAQEDDNIEVLALLMYKEIIDSEKHKTSIPDKSKD